MRRRHRLTSLAAAAMVAAVAVTACAGTPGSATTTPAPSTTIAGTLVTGYVHAGPVCPVVQDPPDPACDDRPVDDAVLLIAGADGTTVAEVRTDAAGRFETRLPAGTYTLVPQPVRGLLGTASPQEFTVAPGSAPDLDVAYDTGIR